jgi:hypothetical protein
MVTARRWCGRASGRGYLDRVSLPGVLAKAAVEGCPRHSGEPIKHVVEATQRDSR